MKTKIYELLKSILPEEFDVSVIERPNIFGSGTNIIIKAAIGKMEINKVPGQRVQKVSLVYHCDSKELFPQIYGGSGGASIWVKPINNSYLAMERIRIPFRKPAKNEEAVLRAIKKFFEYYLALLRENKSILMYGELTNNYSFL